MIGSAPQKTKGREENKWEGPTIQASSDLPREVQRSPLLLEMTDLDLSWAEGWGEQGQDKPASVTEIIILSGLG